MKEPKVLLYDIETTPNLAYVWGKYQQDVIQYEDETKMLCFAYKWLGEKKTHVIGRDDFDLYKTEPDSDVMVLAKLWQLFDEADVVIAHNGDSFDQKMANARFIQVGFPKPSWYTSVDTKRVAKKYFRFNSNKLDDLGRILGLGQKLDTGGFETWLGCMRGDKAAWKRMKQYNKQDVALLEEVYLKLRPWMEQHPAMNVIAGRPDACPKCLEIGSMVKRGLKYNKTTVVQRYKCMECGAWSQDIKSYSVKPLYTN